MKRIVLVLLGIFILSPAYAIDWDIINDSSIEWVEVTNINKELNYEPGGCCFVYQTGKIMKELLFRCFLHQRVLVWNKIN